MSAERFGQQAKTIPVLNDTGTGQSTNVDLSPAPPSHQMLLNGQFALPEFGEAVLHDMDEDTIRTLCRLKPLEKKILFLRLGIGSGIPLSLIAAAQLMSLNPDEAHDLESQAISHLEQLAGEVTSNRIEDALQPSTDQEIQAEDDLRAFLDLKKMRQRENMRLGSISFTDTESANRGVVPDKEELMLALGQIPIPLGDMLRKLLGIDLPRPHTVLEVVRSMKLASAATVDFLCLKALRALSRHLPQPKITGLGIMLFEERVTEEEEKMAQSQARAQSDMQEEIPEEAQDPKEVSEDEDTNGQEDLDNQQPTATSEEIMTDQPRFTEEVRAKLDAALESIPPVPKKTLRMRLGLGDAEPMTVAAIAEAENKSLQAIYTSYTVARKALVRELGEERTAELEQQMPRGSTARAQAASTPEDTDPPEPKAKRRPARSNDDRIDAAIDRLPEALKQAIALRLQPNTITQVAKLLGVSYNAANIRCNKALSFLRQDLKPKLFERIEANLIKSKRGERKRLQPQAPVTPAAAETNAADSLDPVVLGPPFCPSPPPKQSDVAAKEIETPRPTPEPVVSQADVFEIKLLVPKELVMLIFGRGHEMDDRIGKLESLVTTLLAAKTRRSKPT